MPRTPSPRAIVTVLSMLGSACSISQNGQRPSDAGGEAGSSQSGGAGGNQSGGAGGSASGGNGAGGTGAGGDSGTGGTGGTPMNACTGTASGTPANTLTVNPDSAQNAISNGIFGLLMERLGKNWQGGMFVGTSSSIPNTDGMRNDVIQAFKDAGVGMIEWPGGCAAGSYNWSANKSPSNDVGTDRYMELCSLLGIPPLIVGPGTTAAAANNLAWVTYINNNTTHTDWTLGTFKVGNEVWGCGGNQMEADYETNYLANYAMLSTPVNGKKLNIVASTGLIGNWTWFDAEVKNLAGMIDGVEIHDYIYHPSDNPPFPNVGFTDAQYYSVVNGANKGQIGPRIDRIIQTLDQYDANKHIKIYEDEWGDWVSPFNSANDGWLQQGTVMDAISAAETLHLFMQHADRYAMAGLAQGVNVIYSLLLTRSTDSALVKTPTFYVFKMFLPHHRSNAKWAPSTLTSENITGNGQTFPVLSAGTTVDDQGRINISLANVDLTNTRTVTITVSSSKTSYIVSTAQVITGPAKDSYNDYGQAENVNIQALDGSSCSISGKTVQVTLPSKSVVMLVLTPTG
jgi:alpha-N-arabinofuranosidase